MRLLIFFFCVPGRHTEPELIKSFSLSRHPLPRRTPMGWELRAESSSFLPELIFRALALKASLGFLSTLVQLQASCELCWLLSVSVATL